ncbi:hypothetical protein [Aquimarina aggregata]|uniref:hypothetical protein n=1 Tax=Aquimarina aggregata TaxID=1642818 RepID=UPI002492D3B1|nr:hypothetical protein [Aquimarina aggregata]
MGVVFGEYVSREERIEKHPDIVKVQFLDKNEAVLTQSTVLGIEEGNATDFLYGQELKIKIFTKEVEEGTKINIKLKGKTKSTNQTFPGINTLNWELEVKNNKCETALFTLPMQWYSEEFEFYDYNSHTTNIKSEDLNAFMAEVTLLAKTAYLPTKENWLKPISYRRNYEELIGLFNTNNSGEKDKERNYENKFIASNSEIKTTVDAFIEKVITQGIKTSEIKTLVEEKAKSLWDAAIKQVQNGNLDDRPLYWARNKMQTWLKRNPLFKDQIDFNKSIVKKGTELDSVIITFEEKSRNYTGIDFSKAGNKKKVLITGFDPFQLDPEYYPFNHPSVGLETFNPSGILALTLNNNKLLNKNGIFIQTCIFPVRYNDFDNKVVENTIAKYFDEVEIIMTTSRNNATWDIEKYAIAYRGGFHDNMNIGNTNIKYDSSRFISNHSKDKTTTTLPQNKIFGVDNVKTQILGELIEYDQNSTDTMGSGSNYLSNEVMYRTTKFRDAKSSPKPVGHFHIKDLKSISKADIVKNVTIQIIKKIIL